MQGATEERIQLRDWRDVDTGQVLARPALICTPAAPPVAVLDGVATEDRRAVLKQALVSSTAFTSIVDVEVLLAQWHVLLERDYVKKKSVKGTSKTCVGSEEEEMHKKKRKSANNGEIISRCRFRCKASKSCAFGLNLTQKSSKEPWVITHTALQHSCEKLTTLKAGRPSGPLRKDVAVHILQPHLDRDVNMTEEKCKEVLQNAMGGPFHHSSSLVPGARRGCIEALYRRLGRPFGYLESLGQHLQEVDKGNEFIVDYDKQTNRYIRSFLAIGPMRRLLQGGGVRTITSLVCMATGDPVFQGYLLCLNFSDVANRVAPMFIAHVEEASNTETLHWFFEQCFRLEPRLNFEDFACVIGCPDVYDQVLEAVKSATKMQPLLCCAVLVQAVMQTANDKQNSCDRFFSAARTTRPEEYSRIMDAWAAVDASACNCAQLCPPDLWCNAFVSGCRVGMPGVISSELGNAGYLQLLESIAKLPAIDVIVQLYSFAVDELVDRMRLYKGMFLAGNTRPPFTSKMLADAFEYVRTCSATLSAFHEDHLFISHTDGITRVDRLPYIACHRCADQHIFGVPCWHEVFACQSWGVTVESTVHPELDITATLRALVQVDSVCRLPEDLAAKLQHNGSQPPAFLDKSNRRTHFVAVHGRKFNFGRWGQRARHISKPGENIVGVAETASQSFPQRRHSLLIPQEERAMQLQQARPGSLDLHFDFPPTASDAAVASDDLSSTVLETGFVMQQPPASDSPPAQQHTENEQLAGLKRVRNWGPFPASVRQRTDVGSAFPSSSDIAVGDNSAGATHMFLLGHSPLLLPSSEPISREFLSPLDGEKTLGGEEN